MRIRIPPDRWVTLAEIAEHSHLKQSNELFRMKLGMLVWHGFVDAKFVIDNLQRTIVMYHRNFKNKSSI